MFIGVIAERKSPKESQSMIWFVIMCHLALADVYINAVHPRYLEGTGSLLEILAYDAVGWNPQIPEIHPWISYSESLFHSWIMIHDFPRARLGQYIWWRRWRRRDDERRTGDGTEIWWWTCSQRTGSSNNAPEQAQKETWGCLHPKRQLALINMLGSEYRNLTRLATSDARSINYPIFNGNLSKSAGQCLPNSSVRSPGLHAALVKVKERSLVRLIFHDVWTW